jgi:hypothetical protein
MANYYVYFISEDRKTCSEYAPTKIGYASDPDARLAQIQTGSFLKLKIQALIPCESRNEAQQIERLLHKAAEMVGKRLSGEWFKLSDEGNELFPNGHIGLLLRAVQDFRNKAERPDESEQSRMRRIVRRLEDKVAKAADENLDKIALTMMRAEYAI